MPGKCRFVHSYQPGENEFITYRTLNSGSRCEEGKDGRSAAASTIKFRRLIASWWQPLWATWVENTFMGILIALHQLPEALPALHGKTRSEDYYCAAEAITEVQVTALEAGLMLL
eukprot:scaffold358981_cov48-Prasinocladus_malaysianus.AAC.1